MAIWIDAFEYVTVATYKLLNSLRLTFSKEFKYSQNSPYTKEKSNNKNINNY